MLTAISRRPHSASVRSAQSLDLLASRDVAGDRQRAKRVCGGLEFWLVSRWEYDPGTPFHEAACDSLAEAAGASDDHGDFSLESAHASRIIHDRSRPFGLTKARIVSRRLVGVGAYNAHRAYPRVMGKSGRTHIVADLAKEYGFRRGDRGHARPHERARPPAGARSPGSVPLGSRRPRRLRAAAGLINEPVRSTTRSSRVGRSRVARRAVAKLDWSCPSSARGRAPGTRGSVGSRRRVQTPAADSPGAC